MVRAAAVYLACKRLKKLRANAKLQKNTTRFFCTYLKQQGERFDSNNASLKGQDEKRHQHINTKIIITIRIISSIARSSSTPTSSHLPSSSGWPALRTSRDAARDPRS